MKEILKLTLSLTLICAIAGAALAYVSTKTQPAREEAATRQRNEKMELLLPSETGAVREAGKAVSEDGTEVVFFAADDASGKTIAYCAESSDPSGFGGEIKVLVGLDPDGSIRGVLVSENSETPGIGSNVVSRSETKSFWSIFSGKTGAGKGGMLPNKYLDSYTGQPISVSGGFSFGETPSDGVVVPVSGATVSSRAVLNAVNRVGQAWKNFNEEAK